MITEVAKEVEDAIINEIKNGKSEAAQKEIEDAVLLSTYYSKYMLIKPFRFIRMDKIKSKFLMINSPAVSTKDASINEKLIKLSPGFFTVIYTDPENIETFVRHNAATTEFIIRPQTKEDYLYNIAEAKKAFDVFEQEEISREVVIDLLVRLMIKDS